MKHYHFNTRLLHRYASCIMRNSHLKPLGSATLNRKRLPTFKQPIFVLGHGAPHRLEAADLVKCRYCARLVGIAPETRNTTRLTLGLGLIPCDIHLECLIPSSGEKTHLIAAALRNVWLPIIRSSSFNGHAGDCIIEIETADLGVYPSQTE